VLGRPLATPVLLDLAPSTTGVGQAIHVDYFGNVTTNIPGPFADGTLVRFNGKSIGPVRNTYSDVPRGRPLALIGSGGLLELAVREGSAAKKLKLKVGDEVRIGDA
jgi:S-adenosylmethionine hydrolase